MLEVEVRAIPGPEGVPLGAFISFMDITVLSHLAESTSASLKRAFEELQSTVEELETTNEKLRSVNEELEALNQRQKGALQRARSRTARR